MHELSMAEGIIKHLAAYAAAHHGTTVKKVTLEIGVISGIDRSSLEFAFPLALEASSMDKLELEIVQVRYRWNARTAAPNPWLTNIC